MPGIGSMATILFKVMKRRYQIEHAKDAIDTVLDLIRPDDNEPVELPPLSEAIDETPPGAPTPAHPPFSTLWLQESLNTLMDAGLEVDGVYGEATRAAVTAYQQEHGLQVDGWAGMETLGSIWDELQG